MIGAGTFAAPLLRAVFSARARRFQRALANVELAQRETLARIAKACAATAYGRSVGLGASANLETFRERVPVVDFTALAPWIARQRAGEAGAISPGRVQCYEPTSGSGGPHKPIPYNDALLASFRGLFAVWAHDLLAHRLRPRSGRTFMSVSTPSPGERGFEDDRDYLGPWTRALVGRFLVAPPAGRGSPEAFRDGLCAALLAARDLEIVSVWNPGYLLILMDRCEVLSGGALDWTRVWPRLQLVSCWTDAAAREPARRLAERLPHAMLQGKGLLATEAPVTVPLVAAGGCVPLVDEVFLELEEGDGSLRLLHEAREGREYGVVVTQAGGLLRYRLGDRVRVEGRYREAPLLRFVGRCDAVSDLVGEKLAEDFVAAVLAAAVRPGAFATLYPAMEAGGAPHYQLATDDQGEGLAGEVERRLLESLRYREARTLGQLGPVRVLSRTDMRAAFHEALVAGGMKAGDIKDRALIVSLERAREIHGRLAAAQRIPA